MSKSLGNVADPIEAMDNFGVDTVRFYLARVGGRWRDDVGKLGLCPFSLPSKLCIVDG
jgi:isoleucyl-tRNA synthetase